MNEVTKRTDRAELASNGSWIVYRRGQMQLEAEGGVMLFSDEAEALEFLKEANATGPLTAR